METTRQYNPEFMAEALKQAKKAAAINETPVGAVIVHKGKIIARGYNKRESKTVHFRNALSLLFGLNCLTAPYPGFRTL